MGRVVLHVHLMNVVLITQHPLFQIVLNVMNLGMDVFSGQHSSDEHDTHEPIEFNFIPLTHPKQLFKSELHE